jgi:hypothetical protein
MKEHQPPTVLQFLSIHIPVATSTFGRWKHMMIHVDPNTSDEIDPIGTIHNQHVTESHTTTSDNDTKHDDQYTMMLLVWDEQYADTTNHRYNATHPTKQIQHRMVQDESYHCRNDHHKPYTMKTERFIVATCFCG